jgi:hypothetical protein
MRVTTKGVSRLAAEAGLPDSMVERHLDSLVSLVLLSAKRERKICKQAVRAWYFDKNMGKLPLFEVLEEIEEDII